MEVAIAVEKYEGKKPHFQSFKLGCVYASFSVYNEFWKGFHELTSSKSKHSFQIKDIESMSLKKVTKSRQENKTNTKRNTYAFDKGQWSGRGEDIRKTNHNK